MAVVIVDKLAVITDEDEKFIEELDEVCKKFARDDGGYYLSFYVDD